MLWTMKKCQAPRRANCANSNPTTHAIPLRAPAARASETWLVPEVVPYGGAVRARRPPRAAVLTLKAISTLHLWPHAPTATTPAASSRPMQGRPLSPGLRRTLRTKCACEKNWACLHGARRCTYSPLLRPLQLLPTSGRSIYETANLAPRNSLWRTCRSFSCLWVSAQSVCLSCDWHVAAARSRIAGSSHHRFRTQPSRQHWEAATSPLAASTIRRTLFQALLLAATKRCGECWC